MVLVCYLDDSGTDTHNPLVTLAGYIGTVRSWAAFERDARGIVDRFGLTHIRGMDLWKTKGEFKGWPYDRKVEFVAAINRALAPCVGLGVSFSTLKEVYEERARGRTRIQSAFGFCFEAMIDRLVKDEGLRRAIEAQEGSTLSFVLESGNSHNSEVMQRFKRLVRDHGSKLPFLATMREEPKHSCFAIQAADLFAFLTRRQAVAMHKNGDKPVLHDRLLTTLRQGIRDIGWASTDFAY